MEYLRQCKISASGIRVGVGPHIWRARNPYNWSARLGCQIRHRTYVQWPPTGDQDLPINFSTLSIDRLACERTQCRRLDSWPIRTSSSCLLNKGLPISVLSRRHVTAICYLDLLLGRSLRLALACRCLHLTVFYKWRHPHARAS